MEMCKEILKIPDYKFLTIYMCIFYLYLIVIINSKIRLSRNDITLEARRPLSAEMIDIPEEETKFYSQEN